MGLPDETIFKIDLILEELLTNVINYAYPQGEGDVEIGYSLEDGKLKVSIRDWGCPFDPFESKEPDTCRDLNERKVGGLGIYLVRKLVSELNYERECGKNVLTFYFLL